MSSGVSIREGLRALRRLYRLFGPYLRPYRWRMLAAWGCMLGATAAYLAQPWPLKAIFDYALMPHPDHPPPAWLAGLDSTTLVGLSAAAVLLIALVRGVFGYAQAYLAASVGQRLVADVRTRLFEHVQRLSPAFHDRHHSGDLLLRLTSDIQLLRDMLVNAVLLLTERALVVVAVAVIMLWMDWRLGLLGLAVIPLLLWVSVRTSGRIREAVRKQRRRESRTATHLAEALAAIPLIQAYGREDWELQRFQAQHQASLRAGLRTTRLEANMSRTVEVILAAGTAAVLWFGVQRVLAGELSAGDLLVYTAYLTALYKPIRKLSNLSARLAKAGVCGERIMAILSQEPEIRDLPGARPAPPFRGEIAFRAVTFAYPDGGRRPVLDGASFHIRPGETVALVGPSGSGKSTVAKLLLRFYDPQAGAVCIDGHDIRDYTLASLRSQISILLQEPHLFSMSVRDNIAYGRPQASDEEIRRAARLACAHDFIAALPQGYDTVLGERGGGLSAGQRQRIAIARAILRDAPIVVLDEPMTGLDKASEAAVQTALERLTRGRTCLIITHDPQAAARADRILTLRQGRIQPWDRASPPPLEQFGVC